MPRRPIDNRLDFLSPVALVPGLGPKRIAALKDSGIATIGDLLYHFPRRYIDRTTIVPLHRIAEYAGRQCCVIGTVTRTRVERGRKPRFRIQVADDTGTMEALWFAGVPYFRKSIHTGQRLLLTGAVSAFGTFQMVHPLIETLGAHQQSPQVRYLPQYGLSEAMREAGFGQKALFKAIKWILDNLKHYPQVLPQTIEKKKHFPPLSACLRGIHMPDDPGSIEHFRARLRYEELYGLALALRWSRRKFALPGRGMKAGLMAALFEKSLGFALTDDQKTAIDILHADAASSGRMHRLLEGDVGSGKTIVAFFACLPALNEGLQVAWMAPTEVLAQQTYERICAWLDIFGIRCGALKRGISSSDKRETLRDLVRGNLKFVVGTHALLEQSVKFSKLGMIVIDEQHKFGARQRVQLAEKDLASDFLLMSATPIPQTLAKTLYGDLEIVTIRSLPAGRKPVRTHVVPEYKRRDMEEYILREISNSAAQVFYIVPRIDTCDENEKIKDVVWAMSELENGPLAPVAKAAIHGRMGSEEKADVMQRFASGEIKILVSTTLIEVGIDVARATIMVIENAERFGLSQLHQLRGRVGRGRETGFCFLCAGAALDEDARRRLEKFCSMHDGFAIADMDLALRGPGDVVGYRQSGWEDLKVADVLRDAELFREIQQELDILLIR